MSVAAWPIREDGERLAAPALHLRMMAAKMSDRPKLNLDALPALVEAARKVGAPLDGHTLGMIGEAHAAELLNLRLMRNSTQGYDAVAADCETVEIKATTRGSVALRTGKHKPHRLAVIQLDPATLQPTVIYCGPAAPVWALAGPMQKNGQQVISLQTLKRLSDRLRERRGQVTG